MSYNLLIISNIKRVNNTKDVKDVLKVIRCKGAACVSMNYNSRKYYAFRSPVNRKLNMRRYYYEVP